MLGKFNFRIQNVHKYNFVTRNFQGKSFFRSNSGCDLLCEDNLVGCAAEQGYLEVRKTQETERLLLKTNFAETGNYLIASLCCYYCITLMLREVWECFVSDVWKLCKRLERYFNTIAVLAGMVNCHRTSE